MDSFKRAILPIIVTLIIVIALISRLSSCSPERLENAASASSGETSPAATDSSASPSASGVTDTAEPTAPYSDKEIAALYKADGLEIVELREAGDLTLVHYYKSTGVPDEIISRFDWFDRATGTRELVYGWVYADKFEACADKSLTVLTTGRNPIDAFQSFPVLFTSSYQNVDGAIQFTGSEQPYYMPIGTGCTLGLARPESLKSLVFNLENVALGFDAQPGDEGAFYAGSVTIPEMSVVNKDGISTVTLYNTVLSKAFVKPKPEAGHAQCSLVSVSCDGKDTVIKLRLDQNVTRYNVGSIVSKTDDLPYAIISYSSAIFSYPSGW